MAKKPAMKPRKTKLIDLPAKSGRGGQYEAVKGGEAKKIQQ